MRLVNGGRCALVCAALLVAQGASAQDGQVTLKSFDGFTQIRGELVSFDGKTYTVNTGLGTLQIDGLQVNCEGAACPEDVLFGAEFGIAGSNAIGAELMPALIQGYADSLNGDLVREIGAADQESTFRIVHENGREMAAIEVAAAGSATAFGALAQREAALGMSSRRARDNDIQQLRDAGYDDPRDTPREHVIALDGLVIVVHPDNPVRSISINDLARIFSGQVSNWRELGGPNMPINVYSRQVDSGTFDTFESLVLGPAGAQLSPSAKQLGSNVELSDSVASDPGGIGFTGFSTVRASKALGVKQSCGILSMPTTFAMKTEEYPLSRRLYIYESSDDKPAHANQFLDFALSAAAQPLIEEAGFIDTEPEAAALADMGGRIVYSLTTEDEFSLPAMREMLTELEDAERLSTTFRFTPGSSQLDPLSQREAGNLAERLAAGEYAGKEIMLVGFTDAIGQFDLNRELGARRADVVLQAIRATARPGALSDVVVTTRGYGELMPVGCNETFGGRLANRRVEVWIRDLQS